MWQHLRKVSFCKNSSRYEGVKCDPSWETFEGFVSSNWFKYLRAKVKWKKYKRLIKPRNPDIPEKLLSNNVRMIRKIHLDGFFKENIVFTSPSDQMKYAEYTHKYMFEGQLLGTRDIKNILKKRGINITMEQIVKRLHEKKNLFSSGTKKQIMWKGRYMNYREIAEMEGVGYDLLKKKNYEFGDIKKALHYCRESLKKKQ